MVSQNGHHGLTDEDSGHVDGCMDGVYVAVK